MVGRHGGSPEQSRPRPGRPAERDLQEGPLGPRDGIGGAGVAPGQLLKGEDDAGRHEGEGVGAEEGQRSGGEGATGTGRRGD